MNFSDANQATGASVALNFLDPNHQLALSLREFLGCQPDQLVVGMNFLHINHFTPATA
jgi:hypothetical protein